MSATRPPNPGRRRSPQARRWRTASRPAGQGTPELAPVAASAVLPRSGSRGSMVRAAGHRHGPMVPRCRPAPYDNDPIRPVGGAVQYLTGTNGGTRSGESAAQRAGRRRVSFDGAPNLPGTVTDVRRRSPSVARPEAGTHPLLSVDDELPMMQVGTYEP